MPSGRSPLAAFAAVAFCYYGYVGLFNPYAPLWFKHLGFSTLAIGVLAALQSWTRVVAPYAWGWLADHSGRRVELLRLAVGLSTASVAGLLVARSFAGVALCVLLLFLSNGGVVPLSEAALAHHVSSGRGLDVGRYGRVRVWGSIGFIIAVSVYGFVLQRVDIGVFPALVLGTLSLLVVASFRLPATHDAHAAGDEAAGSAMAVLRRPEVAWFFAGVFFTVLAHAGLYAFFSLYLDALGYGKAAVGLFWAVSVAAEIAFFTFQGRWFHRLSVHGWLIAGAAATTLRFAATAAFGRIAVVLVAAQLLHALTFAAQHAACVALVNRHFPGRLRGRGQALYTTLGYGVSGVLGGLAGGALSERLGFVAVFAASAVAGVVALLCCLQARRLDRATLS